MRTHIDSFVRGVFFTVLAALTVAAPAAAQADLDFWHSTDIGSVGAAGSATFNNGVWTVSGDGTDIWGTADSFQFLHRTMITGIVTARIEDLQNTSTFAKAGVMFRTSLSADAATAILDVRPTGDVEFMGRSSDGAPMQFIAATTVTLPAWVRLQTSRDGVTASTSPDGITWTVLRQNVPVLAAGQFEAGVAVTSHADGQLNTAHVSHLTTDVVQSEWKDIDIGNVSLPSGSATASAGWNVAGAGDDIWGTADAFHFLYRHATGNDQHLRVRIESLMNTHPFAKAGLMVRDSLDPDSPTVILDIRPGGGIEFMTRAAYSGEMTYLGGTTATFPVWLDLSWQSVPGAPGMAAFSAAVSQDRMTWSPVPGTASLRLPPLYEAGLAVTSHDGSQRTQTTVRGFSLTPIDAAADDIGVAGPLFGTAATDVSQCCNVAIVQGIGVDIWGTSDTFTFAHAPGFAPSGARESVTFRVLSLQAEHPFAKAGLMVRDTLAPNAMHVVLDIRPTGDVEFMARTCTGCETTFLGTAKLTFPASFRLARTGNTYEAFVLSNGAEESLGTVDVPMAAPIPGYAVTGHDSIRIATAVFDMPEP